MFVCGHLTIITSVLVEHGISKLVFPQGFWSTAMGHFCPFSHKSSNEFSETVWCTVKVPVYPKSVHCG